jgi:biopolymer transport protein TolQ
VVGIMTSFQAIAGSKSTNLAVVAPGIAEALLATAIGLLAAIPAVIAYNKFSSDAGKLSARMEGFADEFSGILSRQIDERTERPSGCGIGGTAWACPYRVAPQRRFASRKAWSPQAAR